MREVKEGKWKGLWLWGWVRSDGKGRDGVMGRGREGGREGREREYIVI